MDNIFRIKKSRDTTSRSKNQEVVSGTLDSIHQNIVGSIRETKLSQSEISEKLEALRYELHGIEQSTNIFDILKASRIQEDIRLLEQKLERNDPLTDYYLKNVDIMLKYYGNSDKTQTVATNHMDQNTFVRYLLQNNGNAESAPQSRKQLFEEYATRMKLNTGNDNKEQSKHDVIEHCTMCNIPREEISEEGMLVCPKCGSEEYMLVVSDFPSFRDPPKERNNYAYKKINHLNEILNQFQAKESTIIPEEVMNEVICEIKKRRIQNIAQLTDTDMREILKKLNRSKYYEHATHILSRLNGNPPPTITPEIEEKIRAMFQEIQAPFLLYCPDDRTNFLSYSYILYKFFELLELDEYKSYFSLLKSRDRLIEHDQIWKKICEYLRWEFISSV